MKILILQIVLLLSIFIDTAWAVAPDGSYTELGEKPFPEKVSGETAGDIVVLQRKLIPKKHRWEIGGAYGLLTDNPFFKTDVFYGRLGFSLTEAIGLEASYFSTATEESGNARSLFENGGVVSEIQDVPENYRGLDLKWTPFFGKVALWNRFILPIENYFLFGYGRTGLKNRGDVSTGHFGAGFSFGLFRWLTLRTELSFYRYTAGQGESLTDTHFNLGLSTFFPGVSYR